VPVVTYPIGWLLAAQRANTAKDIIGPRLADFIICVARARGLTDIGSVLTAGSKSAAFLADNGALAILTAKAPELAHPAAAPSS
jgi:hypothetical protein